MGVSSLPEMLSRIRAAVETAKPGQIVTTTSGYAVRPPPTREELDQISTTVPIVVPLPKQGDGVLNTPAMKLPEAPQGLLTGAGQQRLPASNVVLPNIVPQLTEGEEEGLILKVQQENNALGLTSIRDLNIYPNAMRAYYRLWLKGKLTLRVGVGLMIVESADVEKALSTWGMGVRFGDNWLRVDSISEEPHPNMGDKLKGTDFDQAMQDEYIKAMLAVSRYHWRPAPHLSDDGSLELTLDAYEVVDRENSIHEKRWVVEHIPTVKPDQIERLEKLGVVVSAQFQPYNGGAAMPEWGVPMRDMLDHHLVVGAGSDSHGLGQTDNPFVPFYLYVTRKTKDGKVVGLKEKISREEALRVSTINNAYLTFEEKVKGSIEPGKLADFVILNQDIMTVSDDQDSLDASAGYLPPRGRPGGVFQLRPRRVLTQSFEFEFSLRMNVVIRIRLKDHYQKIATEQSLVYCLYCLVLLTVSGKSSGSQIAAPATPPPLPDFSNVRVETTKITANFYALSALPTSYGRYYGCVGDS